MTAPHSFVVTMALAGCIAHLSCIAEPPSRLQRREAAVELPFELFDNHLVLPLHVGGDASPFRIVLDTGMPARGIVLYDSPRVDALELQFDSGQVNIIGAGGEGRKTAARVASAVRLRLGELELPPTEALVMPQPSQHFEFHDGIVGAELFKRFTVEIDYTRGRLVLHDPARFEPPPGAASLPLDFSGGIPFVELSVTALDGSRGSASVLVDLGAGHALSLNSVGSGALAAPPGALRWLLGRGLSGEISGRVGRIARLDLGGLSVENLLAVFPDLEYQHPRGMNSRQGNLGSGLLRRFDVTFDYAHKRMWLEPTERLSQPFEHDMSGMRLGRNDSGELLLLQVAERSPASEAGLRPGDVLTRVDGKDGRRLQLRELRARLREPGDDVSLSYRRGETVHRLTLRLRRLV